MEIVKFTTYYKNEFKLSYLMTGAGLEIDLVVERPGQPLLLIEIKSKSIVKDEDLSALKKARIDITNCEAVCFANENRTKKIDDITVYPWQKGILKYFGN